MDWFQTALNGASSVLNWFSQRDTNNMNKQLTREQMAFQERMSNTAVQRHAKDLEAAGFNRLLAAGANGASTPSGAAATMRAPEITPIDIIGIQQGRANVAKTKAETAVQQSTQHNLETQNRILRANAIVAEHDAGIVGGLDGMPSNTPWYVKSINDNFKQPIKQWKNDYNEYRRRGLSRFESFFLANPYS